MARETRETRHTFHAVTHDVVHYPIIQALHVKEIERRNKEGGNEK